MIARCEVQKTWISTFSSCETSQQDEQWECGSFSIEKSVEARNKHSSILERQFVGQGMFSSRTATIRRAVKSVTHRFNCGLKIVKGLVGVRQVLNASFGFAVQIIDCYQKLHSNSEISNTSEAFKTFYLCFRVM